ncbi:Fatty acyl-coenzyme A reductase, NAD-binding domain [Dillenia turbinata]|uniref:Fatty acyl-CoA reductase n=1 Tax=Dillenia turbinata TaxID=194707 RepID=A0AAN8VK96_9MAGN
MVNLPIRLLFFASSPSQVRSPTLRGKKFLITGATGFIRKVLIKKILRTVPNAGKIFLLIKAKNKEATRKRSMGEIIILELFQMSATNTWRILCQALILSKLVPVVGNVRDSNLGLDEDLAYVPRKQVEVVINSAAKQLLTKGKNLSIFSIYDVALNINTMG